MTDKHIELVKRVARRLTSESGHAFLLGMGYKPGVPVVSADSNEKLVDVLNNISKMRGDSFFVAVEYEESGRLLVMPISKGQSAEVRERFETNTQSESTIGMLVDDIYNRGTGTQIVVKPVVDSLRDTRVREYADAI